MSLFYPLTVAESGHFSPRSGHVWPGKAGLLAGGLEAALLVILAVWAQGQRWPFHDVPPWKVLVLQALAVALVFFAMKLRARLRPSPGPAPAVLELDESDLVAQPLPPPLPGSRELAQKLAKPDVHAFLHGSDAKPL